MPQKTEYSTEATRSSDAPRLVAVIDIGATSLRMQIAQIDSHHKVHKFESFSQAVSIGKDSFIKGYIERDTIADCVHVLQIYRKKLDEYGIVAPSQIRVIATSGVKDATNRLAFVDRIFVATNFEIEPFEEAELHRVTYLGVLPFIENEPAFFKGLSLVFEIGGGSSEALILEQADVAFSRTYRLGALRLRNTLDRYDAPMEKTRSMMEAQITQTIKQLKADCGISNVDNFVAMGGDIRFAAKEINQQAVGEQLVKLKVKSLEAFTKTILSQTPDRLATKFHMSLPDAQTLGPALLAQLTFAKELNAKQFLVANVSLRDGLLQEMAEGRGWSESIQEQIVRSAIQTGRKFNFDEEHAIHVSRLGSSLFDQLQDLHGLPERSGKILQLAALLHDIGFFINSKSRHKHSLYLIRNSEFFGIDSNALELISLVARYHRGANPQPSHDGYSRMNRQQRVTVAKLAAILRIAKALDVSLGQRILDIECKIEGSRLEIKAADIADVSMERLELTSAAQLFEDIFGQRVVLTVAGEPE